MLPSVQPSPIFRLSDFMTRSSNRCVCTVAPRLSAASSPISTRSNSENNVVSMKAQRPTLQPIMRRHGAMNGVPINGDIMPAATPS